MQVRSVVAVTALGFASLAHGQQAVQWRIQDGGNGHWYSIRARDGRTWTEVEAWSRAFGGYLATMTSPAERDFLVTVMAGNTCAIGGVQAVSGPQDEPAVGWRWVTGEPMAWTNWASWEPSNTDTYGAPSEEVMGCFANGVWVDLADHLIWTAHFLVEWSADCNGDGIVDYGQILAGDLDDADGNGIPDACETPAGEFLITDSAEDFSSVQGANRWRYEFDRGVSTAVQPMPHVVTPAFSGGSAWSTRPTFGGPSGSYCAIGATECATSTPSSCSSSYAGLERPRRRWTAEVPIHGSLALFGRFFTHQGFVARLDVLLDGVLAYSISSSTTDTLSDPTVIGVILPLGGVTSIELVADPLDGSCHSDTIRCTARIFGADCNGDGIVDHGQILDGTFADVNSNGVPDTCEIDPCPGDINESGVVNGIDLAAILAYWGTDGGKFPRTDANRDGTVDAQDLAIVLGGWGNCP